MILKKRDIAWRKLAAMELELLKDCQLTDEHRKKVDQAAYQLKVGNQAEESIAYDLNLRNRETNNWILIHDLRLVDGDDVAQIDHLLIVRTLDFFVLETKNFSGGVSIASNGEFEAIRLDGTTYPIRSPIAQNDRHIVLLRRLIRKYQLLPSRLGFTKARYHNYVLISARGRIIKSADTNFSQVVKSDLFFQEVEQFKANLDVAESLKRLPNIVSQDTLRQIGEAIVSWHVPPERPDYRKHWGITEAELTPRQETADTDDQNSATNSSSSNAAYFCFACRNSITRAEAKFCFDRPKRFGGKAYCRDHQASIPRRSQRSERY